VWQWIALSSACNVTSAVLLQVVGAEWLSNIFDQTIGRQPGAVAAVQQAGLLLGGTVRFAFLSIALWGTLQTYRRSGFLARYKPVDWFVIAAMGVYVAAECTEVASAVANGKRPGMIEILSWPTDPLLWVALAEALLLYRSAKQMGSGMIGRTWKAMSVGVFLVSLGDFALFAARNGYLPWPWSVFEWYVWVPAAACFAMAPAYQATAIARGRSTASLSGTFAW
jgi:hypothetical protein